MANSQEVNNEIYIANKNTYNNYLVVDHIRRCLENVSIFGSIVLDMINKDKTKEVFNVCYVLDIEDYNSV